MKNWFELCEQLYHFRENRIVFQYCNEVGQSEQVLSKQFYQDIVQVANFICTNQMQGTHIGVIGDSSYQTACLQMGVLYSGSVLVPMGLDETQEKYKQLIELADIEYCLLGTEEGDLLVAEDLFGNSTSLVTCFGVKECMESTDLLPELEAVCSRAKEDENACIVFTSGTNQLPKAVVLTQSQSVFRTDSFLNTIEENKAKSGGRDFWTYPFHHVSFLSIPALHATGVCIIINSNPKYFIRNFLNFEPNSMSAVPAYLKLLRKLMNTDTKIKECVMSNLELITSGAAMLSRELIRFYVENGIAIGDGYGMTETAGCGCSKIIANLNTELSVGTPSVGVEVRIEEQEILIKSPSLMKEYYKNPKETQEAISNGWFHTGDLGYFDRSGELHITGRKKNLIILSNGENIGAEELEEELQKCEQVKEVIVYGKNDSIWAEIYPERGQEGEINRFIKQYNSVSPRNKMIQNVVFRDKEFPKTSTMKIQRR